MLKSFESMIGRSTSTTTSTTVMKREVSDENDDDDHHNTRPSQYQLHLQISINKFKFIENISNILELTATNIFSSISWRTAGTRHS